jgi:hypothetical protein
MAGNLRLRFGGGGAEIADAQLAASRSSMTMASRVSSERVLKRWSGWSMGVPAGVIFICV